MRRTRSSILPGILLTLVPAVLRAADPVAIPEAKDNVITLTARGPSLDQSLFLVGQGTKAVAVTLTLSDLRAGKSTATVTAHPASLILAPNQPQRVDLRGTLSETGE